MDFSLDDTDEQQTFRLRVREWLVEHAPQVTRHSDPEERHRLLRQFGRQLGFRGWLYPTAPAEYGGGGMPIELAVIIAQELDAYRLGLPPFPDSGGALAGQCIAIWGNDEQKGRILPQIIRGEAVTWLLATGSQGGSDFAETSAFALWDGEQFLINGVMAWVQGTHPAEYLWTLVRTGPEEERYRNLSWFMIPGDAPGIRIHPMDLLADDQASSRKNTVYLEDVPVSSANLIGGLNNGWHVAQTFLAIKHGLSAKAVTTRPPS